MRPSRVAVKLLTNDEASPTSIYRLADVCHASGRIIMVQGGERVSRKGKPGGEMVAFSDLKPFRVRDYSGSRKARFRLQDVSETVESRLARFALEFCETVELSGGVKQDMAGYCRPVADEEWVDIGEHYVDACMLLKKKQLIVESELETNTTS